MQAPIGPMQLPDEHSTRSAGEILGEVLGSVKLSEPLIVHLVGELGAGKTTFVTGLLRALGHNDAVRSPTYTLIEPYDFRRGDQSELHIMHMDLYRLTDPSQLEELGVRDMMVANTVLLIEWPERAGHYLPPADITIQLRYPNTGTMGRMLEVNAHSSGTRQLLEQSYSHTLRP
jgi:tRNA threonylcarbamoyladenosine biosynthesis protein TsaE